MVHFSRHTFRKGFNLIEAAIVLGVVGLVIGGIWVAAASVNENMKISRTEGAILQIMTGLRQKFSRNDWPGLGLPPDDYELWDYVEPMELLPADFIDHSDLWGGYLGVYWSGASPVIDIYFDTLTKSRCIKLISAVTAHYKDTTDLTGVWIGAPSNTWLDVWPIDPAATGCEEGASVEFNFSLSRNN